MPSEDDNSSNGSRSGISLPQGRSYVSYTPFDYKSQPQDWTQESSDIREGSVRLGSLAFMGDGLPQHSPHMNRSVSGKKSSAKPPDDETIWEIPASAKTTPGTTPVAPSGLSQIFNSSRQTSKPSPADGQSSSSGSNSSSLTVVRSQKPASSSPSYSTGKKDALQVIEHEQKNVLPTVSENGVDGVPIIVESSDLEASERSPLLDARYKLEHQPSPSIWRSM